MAVWLALWTAMAGCCLAAGDHQPQAIPPSDETAAVRQARALLAAGKTAQAAALLEKAVARWPASPDLHTNLGYTYELLGRVDEAVEQYAATVAMAPGNLYAAERLRRLFYGVHFPTRLRISQLAVLPVRLARFQVKRADGAFVDVAVTVTPLFPEAMRATSKPVAKIVPPGAVDGEKCEFNRVIYVFVGRPKDEHLYLKARVFYPSRLLSHEGHEYSILAAALSRMAARFEVYFEPIATTHYPLSIWLCEGGPAGAEQKGDEIFIYRITSLRPGEEWVRELAHELGHARLPAMAGWTQPEESLAGDLGERYLLSALCREAEMATGRQWPAQDARRWVAGLWPPGALDLKTYIAREVVGAVQQWLKTGPYPPAGTSELVARRAATGMLLWVLGAHGPEALRAMIGEQCTLPALAAAYINWANSAGPKIELAARAWAVGSGEDSGWLPFGEPSQTAALHRPLSAILFLPAGRWKAITESGTPLMVRWRPIGQQAGAEFAGEISSTGQWGRLEIGADPPVTLRRIILTRGGEA